MIWPWDSRGCTYSYLGPWIKDAWTKWSLWAAVMTLATCTNSSFLDRLHKKGNGGHLHVVGCRYMYVAKQFDSREPYMYTRHSPFTILWLGIIHYLSDGLEMHATLYITRYTFPFWQSLQIKNILRPARSYTGSLGNGDGGWPDNGVSVFFGIHTSPHAVVVLCSESQFEVSMLLECTLISENVLCSLCFLFWPYFVLNYHRQCSSHRILHSAASKL